MERDPGRPRSSAARTFSASEVEQLVALASGLPERWVLTVEPPYGQVSVAPIREARYHTEAMVVSKDGRYGPVRWGRNSQIHCYSPSYG